MGSSLAGAPVRYPLSKLMAADGANGDAFGMAADLDGNTAVIGAYGDDDKGSGSGPAYVFQRETAAGSRWTQIAKLVPADGAPNDSFGSSVALAGDTIVVGAPGDDDKGRDAGSAYVFQRNRGGPNHWGQVTKLYADAGRLYGQFGMAVAIDGNTLIVGATHYDGNVVDSGAAYVFERNQGGADNWGQMAKLVADDGAARDYFGAAVGLSGDIAIVGAWEDDDNGTNSGSVYIFGRNQGSANHWGQVKKLLGAGGGMYDEFGRSVDIRGGVIVVGAPAETNASGAATKTGSAYVFQRDRGGTNNWGQSARVLPSDGVIGDQFGWAIATDGSGMVAGAPGQDARGRQSGAAYLFQKDQGGLDHWGQDAKLLAGDALYNALLGYAASVDGTVALVGAYAAAGKTVATGAAYVFSPFVSYGPIVMKGR